MLGGVQGGALLGQVDYTEARGSAVVHVAAPVAGRTEHGPREPLLPQLRHQVPCLVPAGLDGQRPAVVPEGHQAVAVYVFHILGQWLCPRGANEDDRLLQVMEDLDKGLRVTRG